MEPRLFGKSAFVTGSGQGIGRGIAEQLAANGAHVTLAEVNTSTGQSTAAELAEAGYTVKFAHVDVTSEASIQQGITQHISNFGSVDILVNNVGRNQHYDASTMTVDEWQASMNLNLRGAWLCSKHTLPHMAQQERGVIINIASVHATISIEGNFPYNVAKAGMLGLTKSLALDWGHKNIRVVAVSPGYVRTQPILDFFEATGDPAAEEQRVIDLHPLRRIGTPTDIGNLVAFLASDDARYITGTEIVIDGGFTTRFAD